MSDTRDWNTSLDEIALALRRLHRALVDAEAAVYARDFAPVEGPAQLLRLVTTHERFAWLRALSELMVDLDELRAGPSLALSDAAAVRTAIEGLVGPRPASMPQFRARYIAHIQLAPDVAMAHHALRQMLQPLPVGDGETSSEDLHERHVESEAKKHWPFDKSR
jgi:hypothetical protein